MRIGKSRDPSKGNAQAARCTGGELGIQEDPLPYTGKPRSEYRRIRYHILGMFLTDATHSSAVTTR